ncbi:hypothetical protein N7474_006816 [Penicillium riverlandense]|uniref:uncharacterized protein n=1 Tax=Penicillium riverlandense TaxID=1903569 RepID=UPI0025488486|nr:uncharacterized protein N7474_006816 [Penicillium riverlandense]KAJ5815039.1 hypothetical protein N7474_006816 [Penicillium riverlandense]
MDALERVSNEIWLIILEGMDQPSVKHLSETCRDMHSLCTPALYSHIDLSVHHVKPDIKTNALGGMTTRWPKDSIIFGRQSLFMEQILRQPELGRFVRSFSWTMSLHTVCRLPHWARPYSSPIHELDNIYTLFGHLDQAVSIDIFGGYAHPYPCPTVRSLFPRATAISLSGQMHYALASAILHGTDKFPLHSLTIDHLHERGLTNDGNNFPGVRSRDERILRLKTENRPAHEEQPSEVLPGDMTGLFTPELETRCAHLQTLTYRALDHVRLTIGDAGVEYHFDWQQRGDLVHGELAHFVRIVQPQVVRLVYSQLSKESKADILLRYYVRRCCFTAPPPSPLKHTLLPVLLQGWPGLQRLEISGGALWIYPRGDHDESLVVSGALEKLENVQVVIEPDEWDTYYGALCTWDPDIRSVAEDDLHEEKTNRSNFNRWIPWVKD